MAGFTAFIDESGCDGFEFDRGSTDFLVIGAIVARTANLAQFSGALERARVETGKKPSWQFKSFKKMGGSDVQRWAIIKSFAQTKCQGVAVAVYKRGLEEEGWKENPGDLYFQASKFLAERISWACRDTHARRPEADPRARIVFSERKGLRYEQFQKYLRTLRSDPAKYQTKADWLHLDPDLVDVEVHSDANPCHLVADYFAAGVGAALEARDCGVFDDRYARLWGPRFYSSKNRVVSNGFKVWPDSGLSMLRKDPRGGWLKLAFGW